MPLEEYRRKRRFESTPEPAGKQEGEQPPAGGRFVIQKHRARRLHYDLRLEIDGVLKSWAVPKGPSLDPSEKRLAVMTEDHPLEYGDFEGTIPAGHYGAGTVLIWDTGSYRCEDPLSPRDQLARGEIKFTLQGNKLSGSFVLVRLKTKPKDGKAPANDWLLIKHRDARADPSWNIEDHPDSAVTGRTLDEIEQSLPPDQAARPLPAGGLEGAKKAPMPSKVEPMLATLVAKPFSDPRWIFELKWDGMRALAWIENSQYRLRSRAGRDVTSQFPELAGLPAMLAAGSAILDGELVVLDSQGKGDFERMQSRIHVAQPSPALLREAPVIYYVFDILYCDGVDLRDAGLLERKRFLRQVMKPQDPLRYSGHVAGQGRELFQLASQHGAEGIVGKQIHSPYVMGRSPYWVKVKVTREADVVIGGFTAPRGGRQHLGALLVGLYQGRRLTFAGGVGSGFSGATLDSLAEQLEQRETERCPFGEPPETKEAARWVKPELVARVKFSGWTREGRLRQPVFAGLRFDLEPSECRLESELPVEASVAKPAAVSGLPVLRRREEMEAELYRGRVASVLLEIDGKLVRLTNLDKIYFPQPGYTKRHLIAHYYRVAEYILPFLKNRPLVLHRYPNGIDGDSFYQKDAGEDTPEWMETCAIYSEERKRGIRYLVANDLAALLYVANLGCIEQHPWSSSIDDLERPDYVFFDLDPTEGADYETVVEVARSLYTLLDQLGLKVFLKTSGATGLHMYLPLERSYDYAQARAFAEIVSRVVAARMPDRATVERLPGRRGRGKVYLDYSQNAYGRPLAAAYSVRPFPSGTVSAPVSFSELRRGLSPERFTIKSMPPRLKKVGDLWAGFWENRQRIEPALDRLRKEVAKRS